MNMEQELGSIMNHFYNNFPNVAQVYTKDIPQDFVTPSLYFPIPNTVSRPITSAAFETTYVLSAKVFHETTERANSVAQMIAQSVRANRSLIKILNSDGTETGKYKLIRSIEARPLADDVAQIQVTWDSHYNYLAETFPAIMKIYFNTVLQNRGG